MIKILNYKWSLTILSIFIVVLSYQTKKAEYHLQRAYNFENDNKFEEAIVELNMALEVDPFMELALLNRGIDKGIIGDYHGAIQDMTSMIKIRPDAVEPYVCRSEFKRYLKMYKEALLDIDSAYNNKPGYVRGKVGASANIDLTYDEYARKNANYDVGIEYLCYEEGISLTCLGEYNEAVELLNFAVKYFPMDPYTRYYRGICLVNLDSMYLGCQDLKFSADSKFENAKEVYLKYCKPNFAK